MGFLFLFCFTVFAAGGETPQRLTFAETYITPSRPADNVDSIAIYHGTKGEHWAIVTAKATDKLLVYDAPSGNLLKEVGGSGSAIGKLKKPNGVLVLDDLLMVVERENHRVQVWRLPNLQPVVSFGEKELIRPYGLTAYRENDQVELFVTDDFGPDDREVLPPEKFGERVKHFRIDVKDAALNAGLIKTFGASEGLGRLYKVESIQIDLQGQRFFISDEKGPSRGIKVYTLDGTFSGRVLDTTSFRGEPEGLGILVHGGHRYLVTTDQQARISVFHLYRLSDLNYVGAFQGLKTANTDGIAISTRPIDGLPLGALWAIHDDQALACFSWADLVETLFSKNLKKQPPKPFPH